MSKILGRVREEIAEFWLELGVSTPTQQEEFPMYFSDLSELDESALAEHEAYMQDLQLRLDALRPLLAKVHKRESYIDDRLEYEKLIMNPERCALFLWYFSLQLFMMFLYMQTHGSRTQRVQNA